MFTITGGKGFHMKFENGVTVSVQFGYGNYCNNRDKMELCERNRFPAMLTCDNAEVAVWDAGGNWLYKEFDPDAHDDVGGYKSTKDVLELLNWAANYKA